MSAPSTSATTSRRPHPMTRTTRASRTVANVVGALGAAYFVRSGYQYFRATHSPIGAAFLVEQVWIVAAYLVRRPAVRVSSRARDWIFAFIGTFGGVLLRPLGAHPHWGVVAGSLLQASGLAICVISFVALGRSFGFCAADRGLRCSGPYAVVRHPLYGAYVLLQLGYVLQSVSWRNVAVMTMVSGCNVGRILAEERLLLQGAQYAHYRRRVRWRVLPGLW